MRARSREVRVLKASMAGDFLGLQREASLQVLACSRALRALAV